MASDFSEADKRIGARVRAARVARGLTQSAIGDCLDLSYQQIRKYELGVNRLSVVTLQRIADVLGVPACEFLDPDHQAPKAVTPAFDQAAIEGARQSLLRLAEALGDPSLKLLVPAERADLPDSARKPKLAKTTVHQQRRPLVS